MTLRAATTTDVPALSALAQRTFVQTFVEELGVPYPAADLAAHLEKAYGLNATRALLDDAIATATTIAEKSLPALYLAKEAVNVALESTLAEGIRFAADHGAQIMNLSLGGPFPSAVIAKAVKHAQSKGVLVVAAAGNTVNALHRSAYGVLVLPADLAPGQWRWLEGPAAVLGTAS